jgi:hypothetical protein
MRQAATPHPAVLGPPWTSTSCLQCSAHTHTTQRHALRHKPSGPRCAAGRATPAHNAWCEVRRRGRAWPGPQTTLRMGLVKTGRRSSAATHAAAWLPCVWHSRQHTHCRGWRVCTCCRLQQRPGQDTWLVCYVADGHLNIPAGTRASRTHTSAHAPGHDSCRARHKGNTQHCCQHTHARIRAHTQPHTIGGPSKQRGNFFEQQTATGRSICNDPTSNTRAPQPGAHSVAVPRHATRARSVARGASMRRCCCCCKRLRAHAPWARQACR